MRSLVYTCSSRNLDPNIRLTFCDGDCISLLFHTLPFLGETDFPLLGKPISWDILDGGKIKGIAEIKGVGKIKGGQWREIAEVLVSQHALAVVSSSLPHPSFVLYLSILPLPRPSCLLKYQEKDSVRDSNVWFYFSADEWLHMSHQHIHHRMPPGKRGDVL